MDMILYPILLTLLLFNSYTLLCGLPTHNVAAGVVAAMSVGATFLIFLNLSHDDCPWVDTFYSILLCCQFLTSLAILSMTLPVDDTDHCEKEAA